MKNMIHKVVQHIKRMLNQTINNQKGIVLPIILMAIGGLSLIGAAAISVSSGEMNISHNDKNYKLALNIAEAGINDAADGIAGNREILPVPLGTITSSTYTFNVGGAALNNTGRYNVTVTLPVVTSLQNTALVGASSVDVLDVTGLSVGDSIVMGDANIHAMATISSIVPTGGTTGTLNLVDGKNRPYILGQQLDAGMKVAKNLIRVTSTGEAGPNLGSTYTAVALWRASSTINANPAITPPPVAPGAIRSTITLQAEYSIQEINIIGNLQANVDPTSANSKLNGPVLISDSVGPPAKLGQLDISPYAKGDYSGPIFMSRDAINGSQLKINGNTYNPITGGINGTYPKIIPISATAAQKADVQKILNTAKNQAGCYQTACGPDATQQIYNVNGYQLDVKSFKPDSAGNGFKLNIDDTMVDITGTKLIVTVSYPAMVLGAAENVSLTQNTADPANPALPASFNPITPTNVVATDPRITWASGSNLIKFTKTPDGNYVAGTLVLTFNLADISPTTGTYIRMYDNSNNSPGFGPGKAMSNGVWTTPLGNIESQQKQGDIVYQNDSGQGTHTHLGTTPLNPILPTEPTIYARGTYGTNEKTLAAWTTAWTPLANDDGGAVLFGGRKASEPDANWKIGDRAEFWVTYYIHTNGPSPGCIDHDIKIVSRTKVTYIGNSTKCGDADIRRVLVYETVWNHLSTNKQNVGLQSDDNDPKLVLPNPHKGYFKWSGGKDKKDAEMIILGKSLVMGDKEFNSVFNHAADTKFHSAIVNLNISSLNMIGAANPPTVHNGGRMIINPVAFPTAAWIPANTKLWDITDMIGNRSAFNNGVVLIPDRNGFDFTDFSIASGSVLPYMQNGNSVLPDVSFTPGAGGITGFTLYKATPTPAEITAVQTLAGVPTWVVNGAWANPTNAAFPGDGSPIMNPSQLGTTTITATISGPWFSSFSAKRGAINLFFDAANGIPFNVKSLSVTTKGAGSNIMIGSTANPATVYAGSFTIKSEDCGGQTNFSFTGKMVAGSVKFEGNVKYDVQSTMTNAPACLSTTNNFIYLKKSSWKELRN